MLASWSDVRCEKRLVLCAGDLFHARPDMLLRLVATLAVTLQLAGAHEVVAQQSSPARTIDTLMTALQGRGQFNGALIVASAGSVVYRNGFGDANAATGARFEPATVSCIASLSKQFTAMAIMLLAERRKLRYDDPISTILPELRSYAQDVTIRHLLNHTSGIPDVGDLGIDRPTLTNGEVLAALTRQDPLASRPGATYRYSNTGYILLATIAERVTGQAFRDLLAKEIFGPLGMTRTYVYDGTRPHRRDVAVAYDQFGKPDPYTSNTTGDGGVFSSVDDLLKWDRALYDGSLLPASTLRMAFEPPLLAHGTKSTYGFGWNVRDDAGQTTVWHTGRTGGYRAYIERRTGDKVSLIMLTNRGHTNRVAIARAIVNILQGESYELPNRSIAGVLVDAIAARGIDGAIRLYDSLKVADTSSYDFSEGELNTLGYALLNEGRRNEAVRVFEANTVSYPGSSNAFDSLGDALANLGDRKRAIASYQKALALDPKNLQAADKLRTLTARSP